MLPRFSIGPAEVTERISFVSPGSAFTLKAWRPSETKVKDQLSSSSLADYDWLTGYRYLTTEETITVTVSGTCQDDIDDRLNELRSMIKASRDYWIDKFEPDPIYLHVRSAAETADRYALICGGSVPYDPPPFEAPMYSSEPAAVDVTVILRRKSWTNLPPQTANDVLLSAVEAYDGRELGNVNNSGVREPVCYQYVANKHNQANLTHIFVEDAPGAFGLNMMDAALPYNLLPAVPATGDAVYFGIETNIGSVILNNTGPFCSLVFDIGTVTTPATIFLHWQYWSGAAWVDLVTPGHLQDNTDAAGVMVGGVALDTAGVGSVHWEQQPDWVPNTVNGVSAYWIRLYVIGTAGVPPSPTQQNRDIYSITWAYAEAQDDQVGGNLPAMLRTLVEGMSGCAAGGYDSMEAHELWVGLRDVGRGDDFAAYLNASEEQNPPWVVAVDSGANAVFANSMSAATGEMVDYTMAGVGEEEIMFYHFYPDVFNQYYGTYQCFIRGMQTAGNIGAVRLRVGSQIQNESAMYYTPWVEFQAIAHDHQVLNMGRIQIPNGPLVSSDVAQGRIYIYADVTDAAGIPHVYIYDLVLIPVDEWVGYFTAKDLSNPTRNYIGRDRRLDIDPIMNPKVPVRALLGRLAIQLVEEVYRSDINVSYPFLTPENRQRLWFLARKTQTIVAPTNKRSEPEFATMVKEYAVQVYNTMRGTT